MTNIVDEARERAAFANELYSRLADEIERLREQMHQERIIGLRAANKQNVEIERLRHMYEAGHADANRAIELQRLEIERLRADNKLLVERVLELELELMAFVKDEDADRSPTRP